VPPKNADGTLQQVSFFEDPVLWARDKQQDFYGRMSGALRQLRSGSAFAAASTLMLLSFGYGVFHAAGPGHGKAVISAWLLATESELRRGVVISLMSAMIQALTAISLVSILFLVVASAGAAARDLAGVLESTSFALIAVMGLYLLWSAIAALVPMRAAMRAARPAAAFAGSRAKRATGLHHFDGFQPKRNDTATAGHVHGPDCGCGHAHLPEARDVRGDWSWARAFSLAFAVGIRPCTGAILVLIFANGLGLYWAGIVSVFAMAVGTFITVSVIAAIAVHSKKLAARMARGNARFAQWLGLGLRFGGGAVITFLGTILFFGSLGSINSPM
jgi:ABC-type nickel/cobalt efflux system permease component RcnA